ncbi:MAG TPA: hypothetical protein PLE76_08080, partial [Rectinema sp.]|nr:hypothetical protein [Rectinema sp.]
MPDSCPIRSASVVILLLLVSILCVASCVLNFYVRESFIVAHAVLVILILEKTYRFINAARLYRVLFAYPLRQVCKEVCAARRPVQKGIPPAPLIIMPIPVIIARQ